MPNGPLATMNGRPIQQYEACENVCTGTLVTGQPVQWRRSLAHLTGVRGINSSCVGPFAGVIAHDLPVGGFSANKLITAGRALVRFLNNANAVVGTWCSPVPGQNYFTYSTTPTGILLITDQSVGTAVHDATEIPGPEVIIIPGALSDAVLWPSPIAANAALLLNNHAVAADGETVLAAALGGNGVLDVARKLVLQCVANANPNVAAGDIVIAGTNIYDEPIIEIITVVGDDGNLHTTAAAFKTVTSITWPAQDGPLGEWDFGTADALGLPICQPCDVANDPVQTLRNMVPEATAPAITADGDDVKNNTIDPNTACNGTMMLVQFRPGTIW